MQQASFIGKLYKYRPWDEYSRAIITENELWFSAPIDFNDPFDCQFPEIPATEPEVARRYLTVQLEKDKARAVLSGNQSHVVFCDLALNDIPKWTDERILKFWWADHELAKFDVLHNSSICCLSETNDNLLMWSHYAEGHKGICLEFTYTLENQFGKPECVVYREDYSVHDYNDWSSIDNESLLVDAIYTKSVHWSYEREWRLFELRAPYGVRYFPKELLTGVIIGCKASNEVRTELIELCIDRADITLYEASRNSNSYNLVVESLKT